MIFAFLIFSLLNIQVTAQVFSVYDRNTFTVEDEVWPGITWKGRVRVAGVNAPEIRGQCEKEKTLAIVARDFVWERIWEAVNLVNVKEGKYGGLVMASVLLSGGEDLTEALTEARHGWRYP